MSFLESLNNMVLQCSGPISLANVQTEFGGSNPISPTEYYGVVSGVPPSGTISLSDFYCKSGSAPPGFQIFTVNGSFTVPMGITTLDVLAIGAGGSGGLGSVTGGGGQAGTVVRTSLSVTPGQVLSVTVGQDVTTQDTNGNNTTVGAVTAAGGLAGRAASGASQGGGVPLQSRDSYQRGGCGGGNGVGTGGTSLGNNTSDNGTIYGGGGGGDRKDDSPGTFGRGARGIAVVAWGGAMPAPYNGYQSEIGQSGQNGGRANFSINLNNPQFFPRSKSLPSLIIDWGNWRIYRTSNSFTVPAGVTSLKVTCIGAGSGATNLIAAQSFPSLVLGGRGGFSGAVQSGILSVTPGQVINFVVGIGGLVGGLAGGSTSFLSLLAAGGAVVSTALTGQGTGGGILMPLNLGGYAQPEGASYFGHGGCTTGTVSSPAGSGDNGIVFINWGSSPRAPVFPTSRASLAATT